MPENKGKFIKRYSRLIRKVDAPQKEFDEADRKLSENAHENEKGLGIEEDEESGQEAYPEIELDMEHEGNPDKEDDE